MQSCVLGIRSNYVTFPKPHDLARPVIRNGQANARARTGEKTRLITPVWPNVCGATSQPEDCDEDKTGYDLSAIPSRNKRHISAGTKG